MFCLHVHLYAMCEQWLSLRPFHLINQYGATHMWSQDPGGEGRKRKMGSPRIKATDGCEL